MSDIFQAAEEGDLARVEELLAQGGLDLAAFENDVFKLTALYKAAYRGHLDVAETLISAGAPLNVPDELYSPLHGAVGESHHDLAAMLLCEGADVNVYCIGGGTPLFHADNRRMAALLIAAGADVNARTCTTPRGGLIRFAACRGHLGVLQELLAHPDINVNKQVGYYRHTPLHDAARNRHFEFSYHRDAGRRWGPPVGLRSLSLPCLETALLSVWNAAPEELGQLAARLEPEVKRRIQSALCTLHHASPRHLPEAIRMRLLNEAFNA